nr:hypothetical protein CFP56_09841 [Quercus suber]
MIEERNLASFPARESALNNRLILSNIFAELAGHYDCSSNFLKTYTKRQPRCQSQEDLRRCCLVNRLWFEDAAPLLWRDLDCPDVAHQIIVTDILLGIPDPGRRQFYAKFVQRCTDYARSQHKPRDFVDAEFANLKALKLILGGEHVPNINARPLKSLVIDPQSEHCSAYEYDIAQEEMKMIFESLPTLFPNLESIVFVDRVRVYPGELERLAAQLPRLKEFDHGMVYVTRRRIM